MSISKRFINLIRSNISSIMDRTSTWEGGGRSVNIEELSEEELQEELVRRRQRREAAERAAESQSWRRDRSDPGGRYRTTGRHTGSHRWSGSPGGRTASSDQRLARLYAQLECPYGADMATVRKCYRAMMRKYHPDMHSRNPGKQRIATDLSQRLTQAYNELTRLLQAQ